MYKIFGNGEGLKSVVLCRQDAITAIKAKKFLENLGYRVSITVVF